MDELDYGPVFVFGGRHKGRVLYYDDNETQKMGICYVGHPVDFVGSYGVPMRFLREPTIDELQKRREEIWRKLTDYALSKEWDVEPSEIHELWAEKSLVSDTLYERRMFGEFGKLDTETEIFLCHSSVDKGWVRMVHDDLKNLGVSCWLDENKIKVGDSIVSKINEGLGKSKIMIAFLSKQSVRSLWTKKEWQSFLSRQLSGSDLRILPALLEDCDVPEILADLKYADFREGYYDGFKEIYKALQKG
ncbi:toll/interleukin-1 receptor domain-containing protein [Bradyrhizobium sp. WSM1417]|uniref:toll/interleukin-1 receptor domain-containing protein n=1 Tax=Bradyrhizobium sp. WSM1417 TaxID=754500 RepID=UPI00048555C2|nr:toll/interleukin-1 receptor domain-containing protein [Bradyrhizobium sp. WSM1417]